MCFVVVTSRAVLVRVAASQDPNFPHCLASSTPWDRLKVLTRTHHTRFTSLAGPGFVAGGANDETTSTVEGESIVTEERRNTGFPHNSPCT